MSARKLLAFERPGIAIGWWLGAIVLIATIKVIWLPQLLGFWWGFADGIVVALPILLLHHRQENRQ